MKVVFFTSGTAGSGRLVRGITIGNALNRKNLKTDFTILSSSEFAHLADIFNIEHLEIPSEDEIQLSKKNYSKSILYKTLNDLKPDILLVDLIWFRLHTFIEELPCKKIFLCHQVFDRFFTIPLENEPLKFNPGQYDILLSIEPFKPAFPMKEINPMIIRNRDEIFSREEALDQLKLDGSKKVCLYAFNNRPGDFERYKNKYSYLEDAGYHVIYTTNYEGGLFPVVDYFNAVDFIICAAGYNQFWEVIYFNKEAAFEHVPLNFSSTERRFNECFEHNFDENGADQLVDIMMKL